MSLLPFVAAGLVRQNNRPTLRFARPEIQATLGAAFIHAVDNLLDVNTVPYDAKRYNQTGLLTGTLFVRAGGGYAEPWTRDASINSWNAASLIEPDVARNTLWAATHLDENGDPIVQRDNQWWDKVIWIIAAWNHYKTTGDRTFLKAAFGASSRLLPEMEAAHFNATYGLFQGPSFFNDGIAGYPSPPAAPDDAGSSFVLDHLGADKIMALSTNCLYVGAYRAASAMAVELGMNSRDWDTKADALAKAINSRFWMPDKGLYGYLIDEHGSLDPSEEGSGSAFVILFDVASPAKMRSVIKNVHIEPYGMTDVYPHFPRFSAEKPGRHNAIVWPMVEGMWARAAVKARSESRFRWETENLARLALAGEGHFFEIYNANTGYPDGGWQNNVHTQSEPDQTWSATAYISMITNGLFGMRFAPNGLRFEPLVPKTWGAVSLTGINYRNATLDIALTGSGTRAASVLLDGNPVTLIPGDLVGRHSVAVYAK